VNHSSTHSMHSQSINSKETTKKMPELSIFKEMYDTCDFDEVNPHTELRLGTQHTNKIRHRSKNSFRNNNGTELGKGNINKNMDYDENHFANNYI